MGESIRVSADFSQLLREAQAVERALRGMATAGNTAAETIVKIDLANKRVTASQKKLSEEGRTTIKVTKELNESMVLQSQTINRSAAAIRAHEKASTADARAQAKSTKEAEKQATAQNKVNAALRGQKFSTDARGATGLDDSTTRRFGDPRAIAAAESALARLNKTLGGSQKQFNIALAALNNYTDKGLKQFNRLTPEAQIALRKFELAASKVKNPIAAARQEIAALNVETTRIQAGNRFVSDLATQFNKLNRNADPRKVQQFNAALASLQSVIQRTGVTSSQLQSTWTRLRSNTAQTFTGVEASVVKALSRVQASMKATAAQSKATTGTMAEGFRLVSRIVVGGAIHRGFFAITSALRESVTTAKEFSTAIAEIETLTTDNSLTTKQWSDEVFRLSNQFERVATDVAEGVYQVLSNQVAQGAEAIIFMETALRLSLATVSDTQTAVNALTAVINSFDLEVSEAARVSNQFFKIIELGRIRLGELANSIGRVTVIASQLGVSFAEVGAFLSLATISGVKANEAQTQLRNVFLKLLKPTDDLKNRLAELGFESGKAFIEARGFAGVMEFLAKTIKEEGVEAVAEMFGRVRAITGALQAGGDNIEKFRASFEKMTNTISEAEGAANIVLNSFGQRFQRILTQASNFFAQEFGIKFVRTIVNVVEGLGGARAALNLFFSTLKSVAGGIVISLLAKLLFSIQATRAALLKAGTAATTFGAKLKIATSPTGIFILITAITEATLLLLNAWEESTKAALNHDKVIIEGQKRRLKIALDARARIIDEIRRNAKESAQVWFESIAETRRNLFELQKEFKLRNEEIAKSLEDTIDATIEVAKRLIKEPSDELKKLLREIESAESAIARIVQTTEGKIFAQSLKDAKDINEETKLIQDRIELLRKRARDALTLGGGGTSEATRAFSEAQKLLKQLSDRTRTFNEERSEAVSKISDLETKRNKLVQDQLLREARLQERLQKLRGGGQSGQAERLNRSAQAQAAQNAVQQRKVTEEIREQQDVLRQGVTFRQTNKSLVQEELDLLKEQAKLFAQFAVDRKKEAEERKKELAADQAETAEFFKTLKDINNIDAIINKQLEAGVSLRKAEANAAKLIEKGREQAAGIFTTKDTADDLIALEESLQKRLQVIRERFRLAEADERSKQLRKEAIEREKALVAQGKAAEKVVQDLIKQTSELSRRIELMPGLLIAAKKGFVDLVKAGDEAAESLFTLGRGQEGSVAILDKSIKNLQGRLTAAMLLSGQAFKDEIFDLQREITAIIIRREKLIARVREAGRVKISETDQTTRPLQILRNIIEQTNKLIKARETRDDAVAGAADINQQIANINQTGLNSIKTFEGVKNGILALNRELNNLNRNLANSPLAQSLRTRRAEGRAKGGFIDFSKQGTDTVPAMLTPGEFVVNRRSTASFLPILRAINSGNVKPQRFQQGGPVEGDQSVSIGDVTINAGSAHIDDTELLKGLKRLHFQGRSRLKP